MAILKDKVGFKKIHDNGFLWFSEYKEMIDKEDFNKRKLFLSKNIETLIEEIEKLNIDKMIVEQEKRMEAELNAVCEALENYDKYYDDKLEEIKKNKNKHKEELIGIKENFDKAKNILLKQHKKNFESRMKNLQNQLKKDKEQLKLFENV